MLFLILYHEKQRSNECPCGLIASNFSISNQFPWPPLISRSESTSLCELKLKIQKETPIKCVGGHILSQSI